MSETLDASELPDTFINVECRKGLSCIFTLYIRRGSDNWDTYKRTNSDCWDYDDNVGDDTALAAFRFGFLGG